MRRTLAASCKSHLAQMASMHVVKPRMPELEHERGLIEAAYELLMKPEMESPDEIRRAKQAEKERRWLDDELGFTK